MASNVFGLDFNLLQFFAEKGKSKKVISSTQIISKQLFVSQQTVSRKLKELSEKGFIECKTSSKGIEVSITEKGWAVLNSAFFDLKSLFEKKDAGKVFSGKVATGLGEGKYYLSFKQYSSAIEQKLGFKPFNGTLNLEGEFGELLSLIEKKWIEIEGFETSQRSFGKIFCIPVKLGGKVNGAILVPERGNRLPETVELIASINLRKKFNLKDGNGFFFEIESKWFL